MNQQEHPSMSVLAAFIEHPDGLEFSKVRLHLARCAVCRQKTFRLSAMKERMANYVPRMAAQTPVGVPETTITDYVDGAIQGAAREQARQAIHGDPGSLKAALHYASHSQQAEGDAAPARQHTTSWSEALKQDWMSALKDFFQWRTPVWVNVPVTAVLVLGIVSMVTPWLGHGTHVATFQDQPYLVWQNQPFDKAAPGLGFFDKAHQELQKAKAFELHQKHGALYIHWEAVPGASEYQLKLSYVNKNGDKIAKSIRTAATGAVIEDFNGKANQHNQWQLSGSTEGGRYFQMQGGFVLANEE